MDKDFTHTSLLNRQTRTNAFEIVIMAEKEVKKTIGQKICDNWNGFRHFIWNSEERTVMGRGGISWGMICNVTGI